MYKISDLSLLKWIKTKMLSISSDLADKLFFTSNILLVIGAALVLIGTIGAIAMSGIREKFADERISTNEASTKRAVADAENAKLDVAEANKKTVEIAKQAADLGVTVDTLGEFVKKKTAEADGAVSLLNLKTAEAQAKIDAIQKAQAPRLITTEQKVKLVATLQKFTGIQADIWLCNASTSDAGPLANVVLEALRSANWQVRGVFNLMGRQGEGVSVFTRLNPSHTDQTAASNLAAELNKVGINAIVQAGVTDTPVEMLGAYVGGGALGKPSNLWIVVGSKK